MPSPDAQSSLLALIEAVRKESSESGAAIRASIDRRDDVWREWQEKRDDLFRTFSKEVLTSLMEISAANKALAMRMDATDKRQAENARKHAEAWREIEELKRRDAERMAAIRGGWTVATVAASVFRYAWQAIVYALTIVLGLQLLPEGVRSFIANLIAR